MQSCQLPFLRAYSGHSQSSGFPLHPRFPSDTTILCDLLKTILYRYILQEPLPTPSLPTLPLLFKPRTHWTCAVWDTKPPTASTPINWVELKTSASIENDRDQLKYERKLLKFWIQSFLLGVPKIIVGFRSKHGILQRLEELQTASIPGMVKRGKGVWDGNICINFTAAFLECKCCHHCPCAGLCADEGQGSSKRLRGKGCGGSGGGRRLV